MDINSLKSAFSKRLTGLRQSLNYSTKEMGDCFNTTPISYRRYEQGKMVPGFLSLYFVAEELGVSLDWLVCSKGPVYYKDKEKKQSLQNLISGTSEEEIKDLLEHMNRIPLLRHEVLACFYKFKADHKELVAEGMTGS
jgi:transcriptional regulator with XRE-family HTH domain